MFRNPTDFLHIPQPVRVIDIFYQVVSGILIVVSAITVGIVNSNDDFDRLGQFSKSLESIRQLETLVENTLSTAAWLLVLSGVVLVWEGVFSAVPVVLSRLGFLQRYSVLLTITVRHTHRVQCDIT